MSLLSNSIALGIGLLGGVVLYNKVLDKNIPSPKARSLACQITDASASSCSAVPASLIAQFQAALNPWLAAGNAFPLLRTDGVLDTDTAAWIDDVNTYYNGRHNQFLCQGAG